MKTFKFLLTIIALVAFLSACSLPGWSSSPTPITGKNPVGSVATKTLQVDPIQTKITTITATNTPLIVIASPMVTPITSNSPTWKVYNYTCELAVGGGTMTMNLAWNDHSNGEEGYRVYRDKQVIATLPPNSTTYVDVAFVATGKTLNYSVEAFNKDWQISTSTITYGCQ